MNRAHDGRIIALILLSAFGSGMAAAAHPPTVPATVDAAERSGVQVTQLKTEHLSEALGIQSSHPRFRWLLQSSERNQWQSAYQILVASSPEKLQANAPDKWDSGKVASDNSVDVRYDGRELRSAERAYWKVRIWDAKGFPTAYSTPSIFEMGLLNPSDWHGRWIAAARDVSSPLLRREFSLDSAVRRARVYVSGLGYYELSINGQKVGDRVLDPASSYYHNDQPFKLGSRVLYATYDVTSALRSGQNVLGVMLGHGWYSTEASEKEMLRVAYGDRPRLMLQMNVELVDGRKLHIASDGSWKTSAGPITYNDLVHGEEYDARLEQSGWDMPGFDAAEWTDAVLVDPPSGVLTAQLLPPARVMQTLPATRALTPKVAEFFTDTGVYDFGQQVTGWTRIAVSGPPGARLTLRYGSRLYPEDDTLDTRSSSPLAGVFAARQSDTYVLKGDATEIWEPRFTLHGFRYVEVRGLTKQVSLQNIEGRVVRSSVESVGSFTSSNELLNRIHRNIQWTFMNSFHGIPQDASERAERFGFLGDTGFVAEDYLYNYDMITFWEKWLDDINDSQKENGDIPFISPLHARTGGNDHYALWPEWKSTYPLLVWNLYQYYGNASVIAKRYAGIRKLVDYLTTTAKDHVIAGTLGDHMEPQPSGFSAYAPQHTPAALTSTAYYYYDVVLLGRMATVLGNSSDAQRYVALAERIRAAFNRQFFNPETNQYATGSQTANALALYVGLVAEGNRQAVLKNVTEDIEKRGDHLSTGIIGSDALVQVLPKYGAADVMYKLANQTTYPSLGHQVVMGATTVCESYECSPWLSQSMNMFASLDKFFYRALAGIEPLAPGFRRVRIAPQPVVDLRQVSATHESVRGTVAVNWIKSDASFELKVDIPPGVKSEIAIPSPNYASATITEGGRPVWQSGNYIPGAPGLVGATATRDSIVFRAGSGTYVFLAR